MAGNRATWKCCMGLNSFWPHGGPLADQDPDTGKIRFRPAPNTFLFGHAPFSVLQVTADVRHQLLDAGFDHLRIQGHPGTLMQAIERNSTADLAFLKSIYDDIVYSLTGAGIGVNISFIPTGYANLYTIDSILGGLQAPNYLLYKQVLALVASWYKDVDPTLLAFELINEPPGDGSETVRPPGDQVFGVRYTGDWATQYQPDLWAFMRTLLPKHTIITTSDGYANWQTLTRINPGAMAADHNIVWTFHPIFPVPAAEEGYIYNQYEYITRLHYPPGAYHQTLQQAVAAMTALVNSDPKAEIKNGRSRADIIAGLTGDLNYYFHQPQDYSWIKACFQAVYDWGASYGIPSYNIGAFEYGATRDNTGFPNNVLGYSSGYTGSTRIDRIRLYRDISRACYRYGFRNCADHFDTLDYGITEGVNNNIGPFDPLILGAIAPKRRPFSLLPDPRLYPAPS